MLSKLLKVTAGTHYGAINSVLYIHFQEYTLKTTYYIIQTNKYTPDANRFVTILVICLEFFLLHMNPMNYFISSLPQE